MNNTVIKVLNREHGQKVREYWLTQGVSLKIIDRFSFLNINEYYGYIDDVFYYFTLSQVNEENATIITLPEEKKELRKEDVYIVIDTKEKVERVYNILTEAKEIIYYTSAQAIKNKEVCRSLNSLIYNKEHWVRWNSDKITAYIEISIEQLAEMLNIKEKTMKETKTFSVSREALGEIYGNVCMKWQTEIGILLERDRFSANIQVPEQHVIDAYKEADRGQLDWLNKHCPKPKQKVKKEITVYANVYIGGDICSHQSEESAKLVAGNETIAIAVPCTGIYEMEE